MTTTRELLEAPDLRAMSVTDEDQGTPVARLIEPNFGAVLWITCHGRADRSDDEQTVEVVPRDASGRFSESSSFFGSDWTSEQVNAPLVFSGFVAGRRLASGWIYLCTGRRLRNQMRGDESLGPSVTYRDVDSVDGYFIVRTERP